jgi:iron complex transport system substrate-binding protein
MKRSAIMHNASAGLLLYAILCVLPSAAAFTLSIFGNANMDGAIDENDITYLEGVINGTNPPTNLSDANYDGMVNKDDIAQTRQIINGEDKELTIIDSANRTVTVNKPVQKIVIGSSYYGEALLYILGVDDKTIVGVEESTKTKNVLLPQLSAKESMGTRAAPDIEKILDLNPEIVFVYVNSPKAELLEDKLKGTGIKVIRMDLWRMATLRDEVEKLGYIFGKQENANKYLEFHDDVVEQIKEKIAEIPGDERPKVYLDARVAEGTSDRRTRNAPDGVHQLCENAGGDNVASALSASNPTVSAEWVLTQNPDVILGCDFGMEGGYGADNLTQLKDHYDAMISMPGSEGISAVKNNRVHIISNDIAFGPDYFISLAYMAKMLHPAAFADLNPGKIHQDFMDQFYSYINFNVSEHGAFIYPPLNES